MNNTFSTVTVYGAADQIWAISPFDRTSAEYLADIATTLNAHPDIQVLPTAVPSTLEGRPRTLYFGIGIEGFYPYIEEGGAAGVKPYYPASTNVKPHTMIPFRIVPVDEDLDEATRASYRMRKRQTVDGVDYFAYYLKMIAFPTAARVQTIRIVPVEGGGFEEELFRVSGAEQASEPSPASANVTRETADTIITMFSGRCIITSEEVIEAINVLFEGDLSKALVSELGIFSGVERSVTGDDGAGGEITYDEAIYARLGFHRCWTGTDLGSGGQLTIPVAFQDGNLVVRA